MSDQISPEFRHAMNEIARGIDHILNDAGEPPKNGFVLLTFKFGEPDRCNYISNADRTEMLVAMKEFIARAEGRMQESKGIH